MAYVSVIILGIVLRKAKHEKVAKFLKILSILVLVFEIVKITWESYWDISTGRGFNYGGILPLYTCSLYIYTMLIAAWGKGRAKDVSLAFISTIGMVSGAIGVVYCNGLNFYPFWTFGAWYSLLFHYLMFVTGMIVISTGYKKLEWKDIYMSWIPMVLLSVIASPVNYAYGADYMQIYEGSGVPIMSTLADKLADLNLRPVFTIIMLASYMIISAFVISIVKLVATICSKKDKKVEQ